MLHQGFTMELIAAADTVVETTESQFIQTARKEQLP